MTDREKQIFIHGMTIVAVMPFLSSDVQARLRDMRDRAVAALGLGPDWKGYIGLCEEIGRELDRGGMRGENARNLAREQ